MYCCEICGEWTAFWHTIAHSGAIVCEDCLPKEENYEEGNFNDPCLQRVWQGVEIY